MRTCMQRAGGRMLEFHPGGSPFITEKIMITIIIIIIII